MTQPQADLKVFDLEDLPDLLTQAEAFWMLNCLAHAMALREAYRAICRDPKAENDWDRVVTMAERGIQRIYPAALARYLIETSRAKAAEGVARQRAAMETAEQAAAAATTETP